MDEAYFLRTFAEFEEGNMWEELFMKAGETSERAAGEVEPPLDVSESLLQKNMEKNRYRNVLPYNHNRVVLSGPGSGDYINASHLLMPFSKRHYILSQGPLPHTSADFWQMIHENRSRVIVMLSRLKEREMEKCYRYYPTSDGELLEFGNFTCRLQGEEVKDNYVVRDILLHSTASDSNEPLPVKHFQFLSWPDFGVPKHTEHFLEFLSHVRKTDNEALEKHRQESVGESTSGSAQFPLVCHCSAGIGRSGAFVVVDAMLSKLACGGKAGPIASTGSQAKEAELRKAEADMKRLEDIVVHIRKASSVQTPEQLRFCWKAIVDWINANKASIKGGNGQRVGGKAANESNSADKSNSSRQANGSNPRKHPSSSDANPISSSPLSDELQKRKEKVQKMKEKLSATERRIARRGIFNQILPSLRAMGGHQIVVCSVVAASVAIAVYYWLALRPSQGDAQ